MRPTALLLLLMAGCSTAPVADVMDYFSPGRLDKAQVTPYGGVCLQLAKGPPLNAIPIGGALPPPSLPGTGTIVVPPPGAPSGAPAIPPPNFPPTSPPPGGGSLIPIPPPPGLQTDPSGAAPLRPTSSVI